MLIAEPLTDPFAPPIATVRRFCRQCRASAPVDAADDRAIRQAIMGWMQEHAEHQDAGTNTTFRGEDDSPWRPTAAYVRFAIRHDLCDLSHEPPRRPGSCNGERFAGPEPGSGTKRSGGSAPGWTVWADLRSDLALQFGALTAEEYALVEVLRCDERYVAAARNAGARAEARHRRRLRTHRPSDAGATLAHERSNP